MWSHHIDSSHNLDSSLPQILPPLQHHTISVITSFILYSFLPFCFYHSTWHLPQSPLGSFIFTSSDGTLLTVSGADGMTLFKEDSKYTCILGDSRRRHPGLNPPAEPVIVSTPVNLWHDIILIHISPKATLYGPDLPRPTTAPIGWLGMTYQNAWGPTGINPKDQVLVEYINLTDIYYFISVLGYSISTLRTYHLHISILVYLFALLAKSSHLLSEAETYVTFVYLFCPLLTLSHSFFLRYIILNRSSFWSWDFIS